MNPISRKIPSSDAMIARNTRPAGPDFSIALKTDPIAQSQCGVSLSQTSALISNVGVDVLPVGEPVAYSATVRVRREPSDLVTLGKILASHPVENIAGDAALYWESEFAPARRCPIDGCARKSRACSSDVQ